jgi:hypothetical protein
VVSLPFGVVSHAGDFRIGTLVLIVDSRGHSQILEMKYYGKSSYDTTDYAR